MALGTITLRRFNGIETYPIVSAVILLYPTAEGQCLNLEIESGSIGTRTTLDTVHYPATPNAEVSIYRKQIDIAALIGNTFVVASSYDEDVGDYVSRFYYYEHEGIDDNVIDFLAKDPDGRFHVRWTGKTLDPNHYDGSKPQTIIEVDAHFTLKS